MFRSWVKQYRAVGVYDLTKNVGDQYKSKFFEYKWCVAFTIQAGDEKALVCFIKKAILLAL